MNRFARRQVGQARGMHHHPPILVVFVETRGIFPGQRRHCELALALKPEERDISRNCHTALAESARLMEIMVSLVKIGPPWQTYDHPKKHADKVE